MVSLRRQPRNCQQHFGVARAVAGNCRRNTGTLEQRKFAVVAFVARVEPNQPCVRAPHVHGAQDRTLESSISDLRGDGDSSLRVSHEGYLVKGGVKRTPFHLHLGDLGGTEAVTIAGIPVVADSSPKVLYAFGECQLVGWDSPCLDAGSKAASGGSCLVYIDEIEALGPQVIGFPSGLSVSFGAPSAIAGSSDSSSVAWSASAVASPIIKEAEDKGKAIGRLVSRMVVEIAAPIARDPSVSLVQLRSGRLGLPVWRCREVFSFRCKGDGMLNVERVSCLVVLAGFQECGFANRFRYEVPAKQRHVTWLILRLREPFEQDSHLEAAPCSQHRHNDHTNVSYRCCHHQHIK